MRCIYEPMVLICVETRSLWAAKDGKEHEIILPASCHHSQNLLLKYLPYKESNIL